MINGNSFDALTNNGIYELFSLNFQGQVFTVQIIQCNPNKQEPYIVFISDGFSWIRGQLLGQAKAYALKNINTVIIYSVIKFLSQDIKMLPEKDFSFELYKFNVINTRVHTLIGQPIPYSEYKNKKTFINFQSGNKISSIKLLTLKEVKKMPAGKISGSIRAKVTKKPDKVNTVMNIVIEDDEHEQMQCCFFGESVEKYKNILTYGEWYRFQQPVLQMNNRIGNVLQLKINNQSRVVEEKQEQKVQPGIIKSKPADQYKKYESIPTCKQFILSNYEGKSNVQQYDCFIIAKVVRVMQMKNDMGRTFETIDKLGNKIEVLLWSDCRLDVVLGQTYKFQHMKAKQYKEKITLQSIRNKTKITQEQARVQYFGNNEKSQFSDMANVRQRTFGINDIVYSIDDMVQKCSKSKEKVIYILSFGYLTVKLDFVGSNYQTDSLADLRKKIFYLHCQKCENNQYLRSKIEPENQHGKIVCSSCKTENIKILWNIKIVFIDSESQVPCKLNSEIAAKIIGKTPIEGALIFLQNYEVLKQIINKKIGFMKGVFKFSCKRNEKKEGERFYNICEYYPDSHKIYFDRAVNELKQTLQAYEKFKDWPEIHQSVAITANPRPIPKFLLKQDSIEELNNKIQSKEQKMEIENH